MKYTIVLLLVSGMIHLNSCVIDDLFSNTTEKEGELSFANVQTELWPYFKRFEEEAARRGYTIDLQDANITGVISDISTNHVIGQCTYNSREPEKVTIDKPFWDKASDLGKEFVVFHELGHCYLGRNHDESVDARGICLSIMRSGTGTCRDSYNTTTRKALIDELFSDAK